MTIQLNNPTTALPKGVRLLRWETRAPLERYARSATRPARALIRAGLVVMRDPKTVTGICWHQTGCLFGVSQQAVRAAGGDAQLARDLRALGIPAHATVFRDGTIVIAAPWRAYLYHGNALNASTVGVEIERHGERERMPDVQVAACLYLARWLVSTAAEEGCTLREAWGHRQSHGGKPGDPGPEIWKRVVIPSSEELGLTRTIRAVPRSTPAGRDGLPIPRAWDPLGV
jgi:hypothetical protein